MLKAPRRGLLRPFTVWCIRRESKIYERLAGVAGVPACDGLTDEGLILEAVEGRALSGFRKGEISAGFLDGLDRLIRDIHARGVAHSDLKKRENILVMESEQEPGNRQLHPVIVDFGAAFVRGDVLFETFRRIDLAAAAKLRAHHQPSTLRPEQQLILDHPTWAERLSRFLIKAVRDPFRAALGQR